MGCQDATSSVKAVGQPIATPAPQHSNTSRKRIPAALSLKNNPPKLHPQNAENSFKLRSSMSALAFLCVVSVCIVYFSIKRLFIAILSYFNTPGYKDCGYKLVLISQNKVTDEPLQARTLHAVYLICLERSLADMLCREFSFSLCRVIVGPANLISNLLERIKDHKPTILLQAMKTWSRDL